MSQGEKNGLGPLNGTQRPLKRKLNQNGKKEHAHLTETENSGPQMKNGKFERMKRKGRETGHWRN